MSHVKPAARRERNRHRLCQRGSLRQPVRDEAGRLVCPVCAEPV